MTDVSSSEFGVLQAKTDVFKGRVVQLAGRIVGIEKSASGTIILARELPVEKHPVFGPAETNKPMKSFAVLYPGKVDRNALWFGNKFIVVAVADGQKTLAIDGIPRTEPYVIARCMHVWKTGAYGSYGIEDYPSYNRWLLSAGAPNVLRALISLRQSTDLIQPDLCSVGPRLRFALAPHSSFLASPRALEMSLR